ncbi:MAG: YlmC/YmxH family sporulation protein [Clostridia bacterium]|nr:YlmC/YmxH family sporulation protein [Clostridia bacterium]
MRNMSFNELSSKEVISCCDCTRLGFIVDLCIDVDTAQIISVSIELPGGFFSFFKRRIITLPWDCIKKIGDDLIITEYILPPQQPIEKKPFWKSIFGK